MKKINNFSILVIFILFICVIVPGLFVNINTYHSYAFEEYGSISIESNIKNNVKREVMFTKDKVNSEEVVLIEGQEDDDEPFSKRGSISDFTNVKYIANANYFRLNPSHHRNDTTDNSKGTCTTVAMQMLLGYHNYYSDRRIIPSTGNDKTFLSIGYGDLNYHPYFDREMVLLQGCYMIGTNDGVYEEIFDRTLIAEVTGIGQAIPLVVGGVNSFINEFSDDNAKNGISISWGAFSAQQARRDIDDGNPIVLGMNLLFEGNFHVVPAYGYAKLDGVDGFLVHYGWGDAAVQVWVPESFFGFQVRMEVEHVHHFSDTKNLVKGYTRELLCNECGCRTVDTLYVTNENGDEITGAKYAISGDIVIPTKINGKEILKIADSAFERNATITSVAFQNESQLNEIGSNAFAFCSSLKRAYLPTSLRTIGSCAFMCSGLTNFSIPNGVTYIGNHAFSENENLLNTTIPYTVTYLGTGVFSGCRGLLSIYIASSTIDISYATFRDCESLSSITIPDGIANIGESAFEGCSDLESIVIPDSIMNIGDDAFYNCTSLTSINLPTSVTEIGESAFEGCTNLRNITIPFVGQKADGTGATHFGYIFGAEAYNAQNSYLPTDMTVRIHGTTTVPANAFYGLDRLKKLTLSPTVTEIESGAFAYHTGLEQLALFFSLA